MKEQCHFLLPIRFFEKQTNNRTMEDLYNNQTKSRLWLHNQNQFLVSHSGISSMHNKSSYPCSVSLMQQNVLNIWFYLRTKNSYSKASSHMYIWALFLLHYSCLNLTFLWISIIFTIICYSRTAILNWLNITFSQLSFSHNI